MKSFPSDVGISNVIRGSKVMYRFAASLAVVLALPSDLAWAEGRCPPGQYPIGGQGAGGCAPIPAGGSGAESPRPTGRWIKTWGAFAASPSGIAGAASGWRKKVDAGSAAVRSCSDAGGRDCQVKFTYKNQCATAAVSNAEPEGLSTLLQPQRRRRQAYPWRNVVLLPNGHVKLSCPIAPSRSLRSFE